MSGTNYGDVALNLDPQWSRAIYDPSRFMLSTVGHVDGVSEAHITARPEERHQFYWISLAQGRERSDAEEMDVSLHQSLGYSFVEKETWTINETIWHWTANGHCKGVAGLLMARPARLYYEEKARREAQSTEAAIADVESEIALRAEGSGMSVRGEDGEPLRRVARKR